MKNIKFQNQECVLLENKNIQLTISRSIGPRILGLNIPGKKNIFAELPDFVTDLPDGSKYNFYGGHRLWMAPEHLPLTYEHDDQPVQITSENDSVLIKKDIEKTSGIEKTICLELDSDKASVLVEHVLKNSGKKSLECAPWAISQLVTGGVVILPQNQKDTGLLPNRSLAIWPYTNMRDSNIEWGNDFILLNAKVDSPFKVGFPNPRGWLAYWLDGCLFVKHAAFEAQANYYDMGSSSECYCNETFLELETLGPKTKMEPGDSVTHVETWTLFDNVARPTNEEDVRSLIEELGIE